MIKWPRVHFTVRLPKVRFSPAPHLLRNWLACASLGSLIWYLTRVLKWTLDLTKFRSNCIAGTSLTVSFFYGVAFGNL